MTENRTVVLEDGTITYEQYFDWNTRERGFALAAFFYGYITTQFIGGYVSNRFGGRLVSEKIDESHLLANSSTLRALNCLIKSISRSVSATR
jgi:MFS family permease